MLERTFDTERVEAVVRHPTVYPHVNLGHEIPSLAGLVENPSNVCLFNEHGGFLFYCFAPGCYDVHTVLLPSGRGAKAIAAAKEARTMMFGQYGATLLVTFVPDSNTHARRLAERVGFVADRQSQALGVPGTTFVLEASLCP
jgi:hypothetical protein